MRVIFDQGNDFKWKAEEKEKELSTLDIAVKTLKKREIVWGKIKPWKNFIIPVLLP